jgi:two-component system, cell cycle sensor histidine kinase and response regulator CckA
MNQPLAFDPAGAARDASARARATLDQRCHDLFDGAPPVGYASAPDGRLLACSDGFAQLLGFGSGLDAAGTNVRAACIDAEARDAVVGGLRADAPLRHRRARLRRLDGSAVDVFETLVGAFDADGALDGVRGFVIDITAGLDAARAVEERAREFRAVFAAAGDAMLLLDDQAVIRDANPAAGGLFGMPREALVGRAADTLIVSETAQFAAAWQELLLLGEARREHRVTAGHGTTRLVECSYRARVQAEHHLCIARDITERRLLEERVSRSEKIESVGRLAGGIAHDFNNLLTAILGYTELLLGSRAHDDPERAELQEIQNAGNRAAALTQQLLAFSRKQVLLPKDVDMNQVVAGLKVMLARLIREDIILTCEPAAAPAIVRIDPAQLDQAILTLVLNARDALPGGGHVRLEVAAIPASAIEFPAGCRPMAAEYVRLRVTDNGVAIPPDVRDHVFEPLFTTKAPGRDTGLGLASVYGIVRQSHGCITVDSEPETGTTFTMHFPAVRGRGGAPEPDSVASAQPQGRQTVLLVEDEEAVRRIIKALLVRQGYRVLEADTPRAALDLFDRHQQEIDLLLTDVVMPDMNGPALAQRLVALRPELRILFISGYADVGLPLDGASPNVSFLSKPFQASALIAKVGEALGRRSST